MKKFTHIIFFLFLMPYFALVFLILSFIPSQELIPNQGEQQFSFLAQSFLQGRLDFVSQPGSWIDTVLQDGKYYWPLGPFPAVLLLPFVYIFSFTERFFYQGYMQFFLVLGTFLLIRKIAKYYGYSQKDEYIMAMSFVTGSVFLNVALFSWSWWFSHVVVVFLQFLAIYNFLNKRRYLALGFLAGAVFATRQTAVIPFFFFVIAILFEKHQTLNKKISQLALFFIPIVISVFAIGYYNHMRFGNWGDSGYNNQVITNPALIRARDYGLTSIVHVPGNLFYLLISGPLPVFSDEVSHVLKFPYLKANNWGMSIFLTSPILIYLFVFRYKGWHDYGIIGVCIVCLIPILLYYGIGYRQFGYRYSLDFLPFLFWLLIYKYKLRYKEIKEPFLILVIITSITNLYFFLTQFS